MNFESELILTQSRIIIKNMLPEIGEEDMQKEILAGLSADQKNISSKYFYNETGSFLFEEITHLEEYYPTRTEKSILKRIASGLMDTYSDYDIIELGSGDCSKISILIDAITEAEIKSIQYLPLDVSQSAIQKAAKGLTKNNPKINVEGYVVDFTSQFDVIHRSNPALICFFGSTIGNFEKESSMELMKNISNHMKKGDVLLLGMDLIKPEPILKAAYNDKKGVTATFNKNILNAVNEIIKSDFNPDDFDHLAFFNNNISRIEMHLVAKKNITIKSPYLKEELIINKGEKIHTENSHKYNSTNILEIAHATGFKTKNTYTDDKNWFAVVEFIKK